VGTVKRTRPPFRADHVGSLLRPAALKQARARREKGEITADALKEIEDREIEKVIARQESVGLQSVTDGEFRRAFWNYDFLGALDGVEAYLGERKIKFQGPQPRPMMLRVTGKLGSFNGHPMLDHFRFVQAHTRAVPKMRSRRRPRCTSATAAMRCRRRSIRRWTISMPTWDRPTARR
jgi:5-methyltetrahydropteroyltriglutamate--homocysteine methyltransferase